MNSSIVRGMNTALVFPMCLWEGRVPYASPVLVRALQRRRMKGIIRHAWTNVPFYRNALRERGLAPDYFRNPEDLEELPLVSNRDMVENPEIFFPEKADFREDFLIKALNYRGTAKNIYWSRRAALQWFARISRTRKVLNNLLGKKSGYKELYIGSPAGFNAQVNIYWSSVLLFRGRAAERSQINVNSPMEEVVETVNRLKPDILFCFGSYSGHLAKFIISRGLEFRAPKIWVYGSDMLGAGIRELIEGRLGSLVYSAYSMNEMGAMSFQCEKRDGFHLNTDACSFRIIDGRGNTVPDGEPGEIVISNLVNYSTVILNYRTGDQGWLDTQPCGCGRKLPLLRDLIGRVTDALYLDDLRGISFRQVDARVGHLLGRVGAYQVIQDRPGHACWRMIGLPGCGRTKVEEAITGIMQEAGFGSENIEIKWVDTVELTPDGKRRLVIQRFEIS